MVITGHAAGHGLEHARARNWCRARSSGRRRPTNTSARRTRSAMTRVVGHVRRPLTHRPGWGGRAPGSGSLVEGQHQPAPAARVQPDHAPTCAKSAPNARRCGWLRRGSAGPIRCTEPTEIATNIALPGGTWVTLPGIGSASSHQRRTGHRRELPAPGHRRAVDPGPGEPPLPAPHRRRPTPTRMTISASSYFRPNAG